MPININTPEDISEAEKQLETLVEIKKLLQTIAKDQNHIGGFIGESIHSIRKWIIFFGILTIINIIFSVFLR